MLCFDYNIPGGWLWQPNSFYVCHYSDVVYHGYTGRRHDDMPRDAQEANDTNQPKGTIPGRWA